jgi:hypothetical protein
MEYTVDFIDLNNKQDPKLVKILEEFEAEKNQAPRLLEDIYNCLEHNQINNKPVSKDIAIKLKNKWDFFKMANGMIHERSREIRNRRCRYIIAFRDRSDRILISMLVSEKIGDSQYHIDITRSLVTTVHYIVNDLPILPNLAVELHKTAMKITGAKRIYAPPLPNMLEILKKNFQNRQLDFVKDQNQNEEVSYINDFTDEQISEIKKHWPRIYNVNTFCFWY